MGNKVHIWGLIVIALVGISFGYQQGNMVFDLTGWNITDQYSNAQSFSKNGVLLDVRASTGNLRDASEFASEISGKVESEKNTSKGYEAVILGKDKFYIFERLNYEDKIYLLTMYGDLKQLKFAQAEIAKIVGSVVFSPTPAVVEAPWEKVPKDPIAVPFLVRHPIPYGWIIFWVIIGLIVWWRAHKHRKKRSEKKESKKEKEKE